jgi:DNA-binding transcriptional ArsR family regulator
MSAKGHDSRPRAKRGAVKESAPIFAALGDETRIDLIVRLCAGGPMSIARLTEGSNVTRQAITKHLRVLEEVGLVESVRRGRERIWKLEPEPLDEARRSLEKISEQWDHALDRLRSFVEDE